MSSKLSRGYVRIEVSPEGSPEEKALDGRYVMYDDTMAALRFLSLSEKKQAAHRSHPDAFIPWKDPGVLFVLVGFGWVVDGANVTLAGRAALRRDLGTKPG